MFNGNNLPHELLLATRQTTKLRNTIENNMATDTKLSKPQISKIIQSGGFLGKLLGPLLKTGLPLLKSVIKPLGLLGLTAATSAIDADVQKKKKNNTWFWSSSDSVPKTTTLIISNKALENSGVLLKGVTETIKNETKEQKGGFLSMLLGTLGASLLANLLTGKGIVRAGKGTVREREGIKKKALMPLHPLTNFEIRKYYENEPRFNVFILEILCLRQ